MTKYGFMVSIVTLFLMVGASFGVAQSGPDGLGTKKNSPIKKKPPVSRSKPKSAIGVKQVSKPTENQVSPKAIKEAKKYFDLAQKCSDEDDEKYYACRIANFTKAIKLNPTYQEAYFDRGADFNDQGNYDAAMKDLTKAIELNPNDAVAYNFRGNCFANKDNDNLAITDYSAAIKFDQTYANAYFNRGASYLNQKNYDLAIKDFTSVIKLATEFGEVEELADAYYRRGNCYYYKSNYDQAIIDYTKAIELKPFDTDAYYSRGVSKYLQNNFVEAINDFSKVIEIDPNYANAYKSRGDSYQVVGDLVKAEADHAKYTELQTNSYPPKTDPVDQTSGISFVKISAGSFMMGSNKQFEGLLHQVKIDDFFMSKYEVTQTQWKIVMGNNPSLLAPNCGGDCPADVSWNQAKEFISKLNDLQNVWEFRLPSEAEWEYAARAGTTGEFIGEIDSIAWSNANSGGKAHPVGQKQPNAFGLYDMSGNLSEWCEDNQGPIAIPMAMGLSGMSAGDPSKRVVRGGSYHDPPLTSWTVQMALEPTWHIPDIGFRVAARKK